MAISSQCPGCFKPIQVPDGAHGKKVRCGGCQHVFVVEAPPVVLAPAEESPVVLAPAPAEPIEVSADDATGFSEKPATVPKKPVAKAPPPIKKSGPPRARSERPQRRDRDETPSSGSRVKVALVGLFLLMGFFACACTSTIGIWFLMPGGPIKGEIAAIKDGQGVAKDGPIAPPDGGGGGPAPVAAVPIVAPKLEQEKVVRDLPGNLDEIAVGGGGRFVLLNIPNLRKIAIFDANEAKVTHYFPVAGDNVKFAASMDKLVMVFPDTRIVQRWSLITREKEITVNVGDVQNVNQVCMGSASNGPLLIGGGGDPFGRGGFVLLDLKTLKALPIQNEGNFDRGLGGSNVRVSAEGSVFGVWSDGLSPSGLQSYVLNGNRLKGYYEHTSVGHIAPSPDGKILYTGSGLFTSETRPLGAGGRNGNGRICIPSTHGNFYLSLNFGNGPFGGPPGNQKPTVNFHLGGEERSLVTLNNIDLGLNNDDRFGFNRPRNLDKRVICIPDAKMIVTIPEINNRIYVHRFDLEETMDKAGIDYLYVSSRPPTSAQPGRTYFYPIAVKSKKGGVKYQLDAGPPGMKLGADGKVVWNVPANFADGEQSVIITISDKAGQEIHHPFKIAIGDRVAKIDPPIGPKDLAKFDGPPIRFDDKKDWPPFFKDDKGPIRPPFDPFDGKKDFDKGPPFGDKKEFPVIAKTGKLPSLPAALPIKPAPLEQDKVTRTFPDTIQNVVLAGGGRFLILHLPKLRQLAIFDVNEAKVVKYLPIAGDNAMIAAGMTKLIVAFPDTKIVQRWNLLTYERELTATLPINDGLAGIGMGYGSDGPLVVQTVREPITGDTLYVDIRTMKQIDVPTKVMGHVHRGASAQMRGSADGRAFGITSGGAHAYTITIQPDGAPLRGAGDFGGGGAKVIPGPDGKTFFGMGLYTPEMKRLAGSPAMSMACVPALHGQFYLAIPAGTFHPGIPGEKKSTGVELRIVGDNRPLLTLTDVETAMRDVFSGGRDPLPIEQRYHLIPDAQLLVTIPNNNDRLVLRKLDIDAALDKSGVDYLFVASNPFPFAVLGDNYSYPVQVKTKKGGLKYRVDSGPAGMKVSAGGALSWKVPADFKDSETDVIMTISDAAGQEIFHTFKVSVVKELPPEAKQIAKVDPKVPVKEPIKKDPEPDPIVKAPPPGPDALTIKAPKLDGDVVTRQLPDSFDQIVLGGGGRFILMHLPRQKKVAMFDANEAKVVHYFPVSGDGVRLAAGLEKLVLVFPDTKIIQRWNLLTKEREVTTTVDFGGSIKNAMMGSASTGPLIIAGGERFGGGGHVFLELDTLKPRVMDKQAGFGGRGLSEYARISADGSVIACWGSGSPSGLQTYHVTKTGLKSYYEHISPGHLVPSPDGKIIYTGRGMFTNETKPLGVNTKSRDGMGPWSIPSVHGNYYLSVNLNGMPRPTKKKGGGGGDTVTGALSVHLAGEDRTLVTLPNIELPRELNPWGREQLGGDRRIMFIPDAKMIVIAPDTNDRLVLHRFEIEEALDKAGIDYLYATSRAPTTAAKGKEFAYQIMTRSKKGNVTYRLDAGPEGMRVTKAGVVHWKVPADHPPGETNVIITIGDASGQEVFHTFRVNVVDAALDNGAKK